MNKILKYTLRTIIIGIPTILTFNSVIHISHCRIDYKICGLCVLSVLWLLCLAAIVFIAFIVFINNYWDEIWSKDDE